MAHAEHLTGMLVAIAVLAGFADRLGSYELTVRDHDRPLAPLPARPVRAVTPRSARRAAGSRESRRKLRGQRRGGHGTRLIALEASRACIQMWWITSRLPGRRSKPSRSCSKARANGGLPAMRPARPLGRSANLCAKVGVSGGTLDRAERADVMIDGCAGGSCLHASGVRSAAR